VGDAGEDHNWLMCLGFMFHLWLQCLRVCLVLRPVVVIAVLFCPVLFELQLCLLR
jgi:hypothetical protein